MTASSEAAQGVPGFKVAGVSAGLKADGKLDFALIVSDTPCVAAGVFTLNRMKAAPVLVDLARLAKRATGYRAVAINTRCANACTGEQGIANAEQTARWVAERLGCAEDEVLVMSTGVIGTHLPMEKIKHGIALAADALSDSPEAWARAAEAIMTTDTKPKAAYARVQREGGEVAINGIAKGAGMIAPNMATMLGILATNAALMPESASALLKNAADHSFNRIVVDGDMSTNDTVLLLANGVGSDLGADAALREAVMASSAALAKMIVRDGEGATKFITIQVFGAENDSDAKLIANTIATSPLVKTAFYGGDANWGRIVAAAGRSGVALDPKQLKLWIAGGEEHRRDLLLFDNAMPTAYDEAQATAVMAEPSINVTLDCGQGKGSAVVWTCDLTHEYVSVNGHYRS
jgi:glutamate N-acetyltransferase / amino-acid N-acetyltransferase